MFGGGALGVLRRRAIGGVTCLLLTSVMLLAGPGVDKASAEPSLPLGFVDQHVAVISQPTALAFTPDGRILVTSKPGQLRVIKNDQLIGTPAIDLASKICSDLERGLVGVAVDPAFTSNHFIYLFYTFKKFGGCPVRASNTPVNRVSRFLLPDTNVINPLSETILIDNISNYGGLHTGGDLQFGRDGFLYVSTGDGGCDYSRNHLCGGGNQAARDRHQLVGKILRITRDGGIPPGNPFTGVFSARCNVTGSTIQGYTCRETFAWGLRNPFRMAFDPNALGTRFYVNDVGDSRWEEIDLGVAGADYGYNVREGHCSTGSYTNCGTPPAGMTNPIFDYPHTSGCTSITGGAFVPVDAGWPLSFSGVYLFADFVCGSIFRLDQSGSGYVMSPFVTGLGSSSFVHVAFGPAPGGKALYYLSFGGMYEASVRRILFASNGEPVASLTATPTAGAAPLVVGFDGSGSRDPNEDPLTYLWDFGDGETATTSTGSISHTYAVEGQFSASLRVQDPGGLVSDPAVISIAVGNNPPQPDITTPAEGATFAVGQTIALTGSATDAEDGPLPASQFSWTVVRHHADHIHPYFGPATGNGLTITAPAPEDALAATNSYLEVILTVTDSGGLSTTASRLIEPRKVALTFFTNPSGLKLVINGIYHTAPSTITSWENWGILVNAPSPQGTAVFRSWSDGGAQQHTIVTPAIDWKSYTAKYAKPL